MIPNETLQDGFCTRHALYWHICDLCREAYLRESMLRWAERQKIIQNDYYHYHTVVEPLYAMLCGNPK